MDGYSCSSAKLNLDIHSVFDDIVTLEPKARFGYFTDTDISSTFTDKLHPYGSRFYTQYIVGIGAKTLLENLRNGFVRDKDYIYAMKAIFHEKHHVYMRARQFMRSNVSELVKQMARVSVAGDFLDEYYDIGYCRNPEEIACEYYAISELEKFFEKHPVDFDWKSIVLK